MRDMHKRRAETIEEKYDALLEALNNLAETWAGPTCGMRDALCAAELKETMKFAGTPEEEHIYAGDPKHCHECALRACAG